MTTKLTDRGIQALKAQSGKRVELGDTVVVGLRVRATVDQGVARRVFYFRYRHRDTGKLVPMRMGEYPAMTLAQAREIALGHRNELDVGVDPRNAEATRRTAAAPEDTYTVADLADDFLKHAQRTKAESTMRDYRRYMGVLESKWGERPAEEIRRGDVIDLLDRQSEKGYRSAGLLLAVARAAWNFAIEREKLEVTPWAGLKRQNKAFRAREKERALSDSELRSLQMAKLGSGLPPATQLVLRLILWTGCRPGEACGAEWREIDLNESTWTIPSARAKARRTHVIMLSTQAASALKKLKRGRHRYVFPTESGHLDTTLVSQQLRRVLGSDGLQLTPFTPHDLRRSTATGLARMGAPREVIKRVLAHADSDVTAIYQRHTYDEAARGWLQKWADHLESLTADNVLPLDRGLTA